MIGQEASQRIVDAAMYEQPDLKLVLEIELRFKSLFVHRQVDMSVFQAVKMNRRWRARKLKRLFAMSSCKVSKPY